jgi:hypothetical protein
MHGKENAIVPLVRRWLGLHVMVAHGLDTDAFGTFTRDIARAGSPRDAAQRKIDAAFAMMPGHQIGLASEGSFGPHPQLPFCAVDREIVLLVDRENGHDVVGHFATADTNHGNAAVDGRRRRPGICRACRFSRPWCDRDGVQRWQSGIAAGPGKGHHHGRGADRGARERHRPVPIRLD